MVLDKERSMYFPHELILVLVDLDLHVSFIDMP